jgi:type VI secretion system protein ImpG
MDPRLQRYEQELAQLRSAGRRFAEHHPNLAAELAISGDACADPEVERLLQSVALLNASTAAKVDDDYNAFTSDMLALVQPMYLRPIPSLAMAHVDASGTKPQDAAAFSAPRGSVFKAGTCSFRSVYDVQIAPVVIDAARFVAAIDVPATLPVPRTSVCALKLSIASALTGASLNTPPCSTLRIHIDAPPELRAALLDSIFLRTLCVCMEADGAWTMLAESPFLPVGLEVQEALLPAESADHPLRLLAEYFALPEKFDFFDIDLAALSKHCPAQCRSLTLHLALPDLRDTPLPGILGALAAHQLRTGCTPLINLFQCRAASIKLDGRRDAYIIPADLLKEDANDIYTIDSVQLLCPGQKDAALEFKPFMSPGRVNQESYWMVRREDNGSSYDHALTLIDHQQTSLGLENGMLAVGLCCTQGDVPASLPFGQPDGDLSIEAASTPYPVRLLGKPTNSRFLASERGEHWTLIHHLSTNHHKLTQDGLPQLIDMLRLHAPPFSSTSRRQLEGLRGLSHCPCAGWVATSHGQAYMHGLELRLVIDQQAFSERSVFIFAEILSRYLAMYVHGNRYTQLIVLSEANREIMRCQPRTGHKRLV